MINVSCNYTALNLQEILDVMQKNISFAWVIYHLQNRIVINSPRTPLLSIPARCQTGVSMNPLNESDEILVRKSRSRHVSEWQEVIS